MYKRIRNPDTRVSKPISAWKPPARCKIGQQGSQDQIISSTPTVPVPRSSSENVLSSQTTAKLNAFRFHETTQDLLAGSAERRNVTVFSRDRNTSPVILSQRNQNRYGEFVSEYSQDTVVPKTQTIQPDSGDEYVPSGSGGEDGHTELEQYFTDGTQEELRNTDEFDGTARKTTSTETSETVTTPRRERREVEPSADCKVLVTFQDSPQRGGTSSRSLSPDTDNEFDIDDDVFRDFQATHPTGPGHKNALAPIVPSSMAVEHSPLSSDTNGTTNASKTHALMPFQGQVSEQNDLTLQALPFNPNPGLDPEEADSTLPQDRTCPYINTVPINNAQMIRPYILPGPTGPHAHPDQHPPSQPVPEAAFQEKKERPKQAEKPNILKPFVRPPFSRPVHDRSPIQGLTSSHTLLRTCFRIGEALIVCLSQGASTQLAPKPPKPSLPSQLDPLIPPPSKPETGPSATPTILIELYALVESSHRINNTQYFTFADLFFPLRPPYLAGVWEGCAANAVFEEDGRAFLGPGGREWRWNDASKRSKNGGVEGDDGCGGRKMCRVVGVIERDGNGKGNGMQGVTTLPGQAGDVVVMSVLSIWKATWSDVEYVKGIVEA